MVLGACERAEFSVCRGKTQGQSEATRLKVLERLCLLCAVPLPTPYHVYWLDHVGPRGAFSRNPPIFPCSFIYIVRRCGRVRRCRGTVYTKGAFARFPFPPQSFPALSSRVYVGASVSRLHTHRHCCRAPMLYSRRSHLARQRIHNPIHTLPRHAL